MANPRGSVVIAGKYRMGRALARGGMGAVWQAHHLQLDIPVAIKFMDAGLAVAADACARFEREARSAAMIRSPHVVQILDHGVDAGMRYIVMELLEGENLGDRLRRDRRLTIPDAANIMLQVAKALRRAHEAGIVHRDLKPTNIFLAKVDEEEIVKVLDFGIAKAALAEGDNSVTKTGVVMGSPSYMSPEQARDIKSVDHRADLWSLGVVLFRALTGEMIFQADSNVDLMLKLCSDPVPPATSVAPDLPREFDAFFERAFCRDVNSRFQSAREMAYTLAELVRRLGFGDELATLQGFSMGFGSMHPGPISVHGSNPPSFIGEVTVVRIPPPPATGVRPPSTSTPSTTGDAPASVTSPPGSNAPPSSEMRLGQVFRTRQESWRPEPMPMSEAGGTVEMGSLPSQVSDLIDEGFRALRAGDHDTARRCWSEALSLDPSNRMIELNLRRLETLGS